MKSKNLFLKIIVYWGRTLPAPIKISEMIHHSNDTVAHRIGDISKDINNFYPDTVKDFLK